MLTARLLRLKSTDLLPAANVASLGQAFPLSIVHGVVGAGVRMAGVIHERER